MSARHAIDVFAEPISRQDGRRPPTPTGGARCWQGASHPAGWPKGSSGPDAALGSQHQRPRVVPGIGQLGRAVGGADLHGCEPISPMRRLHLTAHRPLPVLTAPERAEKRNRNCSQHDALASCVPTGILLQLAAPTPPSLPLWPPRPPSPDGRGPRHRGHPHNVHARVFTFFCLRRSNCSFDCRNSTQ
jgi:hypothetical protein